MANISGMNFSVKKEFRDKQKNQRGVVLWFTGLSGAGKTTIANELDQLLIANNNHSYILDGDVFRNGLSSDLSFTKKDREENLRRIKYVAKMFCDAGDYFDCYVYFSICSRSKKSKRFIGRLYY